MCTLCLSDMGELRDDWLREPRQAGPATPAKAPAAAAAPMPASSRNEIAFVEQEAA